MSKLNLGCGDSRYEGFLNLDISDEFSPDIICDLKKGLPFKDDSIDEIRASHVIEHLPDTIFIMNEIWRVCKNNAIVNIEVPHQASMMAFADPTHKRVFNEESFKYFCSNSEHYWIHKSYGIKCNFELVKQKTSRNSRYGYVRVKLKALKGLKPAQVQGLPTNTRRRQFSNLLGMLRHFHWQGLFDLTFRAVHYVTKERLGGKK